MYSSYVLLVINTAPFATELTLIWRKGGFTVLAIGVDGDLIVLVSTLAAI